MSKRYRASAVDDDILNSTNTFAGYENSGIDYSYTGSALEDNLVAYHSIQYSTTVNGAFEFGHDDARSVLPLATNLGNCISNSSLNFGNLESVSGISADDCTAFDYDFSHYDFSTFSFDDYFHFDPDHPPIKSAGVAATSSGFPSSSTMTPDSPLNSQSSPSPSQAGFLHTQWSTEAASSLGSRSPAPAAKLLLPPSPSFECKVCRKTFAVELRLMYAHPFT